jgi:uncharacterized protein YndB with AHSA1/START domain
MNSKYTTTTYSVSTEFARSPKEVFDHITNLSKWWPEDFVGEGLSLGAEFVFEIGDSHYSKNIVIEFVPNEKLVWLTTQSIRKSDNYDWSGTKMIFELSPEGGNTVVKFTYDGPVLENELERLIQICDCCIKTRLYNFIESVTASIEVAVSPTDVFKIITADVAKWWGGKDLSGSATMINDEFVIHHPGAHYSKQKVVELIPAKKVVWLVTESELDWLKNDKAEWTNTRMIFELTRTGDNTRIDFTHEGLVPTKECYEQVSVGWNMIITDFLFHYITEGKVAEQLFS